VLTLGASQPRLVSAGGIRVSNLPTWAIWSIAAAVVLSPALAFVMAIGVEILISTLTDAGISVLLPLAVAVALGSRLLRLHSRPGGKASDRM
jgi:hypothetical protein